jgi:hypothetical protein
MNPTQKQFSQSRAASKIQIPVSALLVILGTSMMFCCASIPIQAEASKTGDASDIDRLQGQWERELTAENTKDGFRRIIKEIKGNKETVTFYGEGDKLLRKQTVDFRLEKNGEIHVFTYFNFEVTDGDGAGTKRQAPVSYVYRVDLEYFFEVTGLLPGQTQQPVAIFRWKRVKN